jgi:hypothetical protein
MVILMRRLFCAFTLALALGGCFSPDKPVCSFSCGTTSPQCPDDYTCQADGICHLNGQPITQCPFADAAMAPDMSVPLDLSLDIFFPADGPTD